MKKLLLAVAFTVSMLAGAQNYPGENIELIAGKEITVLHTDSNQKHGYQNFFTDEKMKKTYKGKQGFSDYAALVGKTFKVASYEPYTNNIGVKRYKVKLENAETGTLYLDYDTQYSHTFPFEVKGGLAYPEGFFCNKAAEKKSDNNDRRYDFPYINGVLLSYYTADTFQYMIFTINVPAGKTFPATLLKGATLTFDNGETIDRPELVLPINNSDNGLVASAVFGLLATKNEKEINLFKNHQLVDIQLNKYTRKFKEGFTLQEYVKCATK